MFVVTMLLPSTRFAESAGIDNLVLSSLHLPYSTHLLSFKHSRMGGEGRGTVSFPSKSVFF